ncbi:histidine phosphatase family protein [Duganella callida]|uniref:Multiple inositol polyphosphate phosphatase 1 n=1 Tax=Duganella callida TaxID=2561932 RepID=A0A4Y9S374_9BURK|nr:histidine phosphatase family protein [Duganella callida]TFW15816.1 histidine-type phosphatase [Duganella callida]
MKPLCLAAGAALSLLLSNALGEQYYQTKTPYQPQQDSASYEAPPAGYRPVYTQLLARHGSRGLSSFKTDLALYNLWRLAQREDALTPLGKQLGADLEAMMKANALLGYGVAGISKPGYGNESLQGVQEHTQMAQRLYARLPSLFDSAARDGRKIIVVTSGKDRAVDSGYFFSRALVQRQPSLQPLVDAGTDRFLLYFHKLGKQDQVTDQLRPTYEASLAYQRWARSETLKAIEADIHARPGLKAAARTTLAGIFKPAFIEALDAGQRSAANTGTRDYTSADGKFTNHLEGDGDTHIVNATEAALALYEMYAAAADMQAELKADFTRYIAPDQARVYAETEDAIAFYEKGPGRAENGDLNWRMAGHLLADFFKEADAIAAGDLSHAAKLRFAHAETVIPLAAAFGLSGMSEPLPAHLPYSYQHSNWRGDEVAPMAANIQWDLYRNVAGETVVRMLYNEKETAFPPLCQAARLGTYSKFYNYKLLRSCYNKIIVNVVDVDKQ